VGGRDVQFSTIILVNVWRIRRPKLQRTYISRRFRFGNGQMERF